MIVIKLYLLSLFTSPSVKREISVGVLKVTVFKSLSSWDSIA